MEQVNLNIELPYEVFVKLNYNFNKKDINNFIQNALIEKINLDSSEAKFNKNNHFDLKSDSDLEIKHLENEFDNYKSKYPYEE